MAVMGEVAGFDDTYLLALVGLLLFSVVCFLYAWWMMLREENRGHSYKPLEPDEEFDED